MADTTSLTLLGRAQSQDEDAWQQLVHLYGPLVQKWCRQFGLQDEDIADVFQESFVRSRVTLSRLSRAVLWRRFEPG